MSEKRPEARGHAQQSSDGGKRSCDGAAAVPDSPKERFLPNDLRWADPTFHPPMDQARQAARDEVARRLASPQFRQMFARLASPEERQIGAPGSRHGAASDRWQIAGGINSLETERFVRALRGRDSVSPASVVHPSIGTSPRHTLGLNSRWPSARDQGARMHDEPGQTVEEVEARLRQAATRRSMFGTRKSSLLAVLILLLGIGGITRGAWQADTQAFSSDVDAKVVRQAPDLPRPIPKPRHTMVPGTAASEHAAGSRARSGKAAISEDVSARPSSVGYPDAQRQTVGTPATSHATSVSDLREAAETVPQETWSSAGPTTASDPGGVGRSRPIPQPLSADAQTRAATPLPTTRPDLPPQIATDRIGGGQEEPYLADDQAGFASARVVVHYSTGGRDDAEALADVLRHLGIGQAELRSVPLTISNTNVRYFHDQSRGAAENVSDLLRALGARSVIVKDFTSYSPPPSKGTIEVWLRS